MKTPRGKFELQWKSSDGWEGVWTDRHTSSFPKTKKELLAEVNNDAQVNKYYRHRIIRKSTGEVVATWSRTGGLKMKG